MEVERFGERKPRDINEEVYPIATRFIKQISLVANNKYKDGSRMTAAIALGILERIMINVTLKLHGGDIEQGKVFISAVYDAGKKDALEQWQR